MGYESRANPIREAVEEKVDTKVLEDMQAVKVLAEKIRTQDDWDAVMREVDPVLRDQVRGLLSVFLNFTPEGDA
jgi:hypothetical protein|tara:strand:+ start:1553 stop:1774 length:222 start_codon:yes stop_codon:yes gene_type:complete